MPTYQEILTDLQGMSASGKGSAIFYSGQQNVNGEVQENKDLAEECQQDYSSSTYTIFQTQVGQYLNSAAVTEAGLTTTQYNQLWSIASQMMAQQATGSVIAFVDGELPSVTNAAGTVGTFEQYELPTLLGNSNVTGSDGSMTINNGVGGTYQNTLNWNSGGSQLQNFPSVAATGVAEQYQDYTGTSGTGTELGQVNSYAAGGSQLQILSTNAGGISTGAEYFTGADMTGRLAQVDENYTAGGSAQILFLPANSSSGVSTEISYYNAANESGNTENLFNYAAGGSMEQLLDPDVATTGISLEDISYNGEDATGNETQAAVNYIMANYTANKLSLLLGSSYDFSWTVE